MPLATVTPTLLAFALALVALLVAIAITAARFLLVWWRDRGRGRFEFERCRHEWLQEWHGPAHRREAVTVCRHCRNLHP